MTTEKVKIICRFHKLVFDRALLDEIAVLGVSTEWQVRGCTWQLNKVKTI